MKFFEIFQKYFMKYFRAKKIHEILHHYSELRLAVIRKMQENARLSLFYKSLHRLAAASCPRAWTLQDALDTAELIHLGPSSCHLALMPTSSHFSQEQWQIGTLFLPPPEPSSLLMPSESPPQITRQAADRCWAMPRDARWNISLWNI